MRCETTRPIIACQPHHSADMRVFVGMSWPFDCLSDYPSDCLRALSLAGALLLRYCCAPSYNRVLVSPCSSQLHAACQCSGEGCPSVCDHYSGVNRTAEIIDRLCTRCHTVGSAGMRRGIEERKRPLQLSESMMVGLCHSTTVDVL